MLAADADGPPPGRTCGSRPGERDDLRLGWVIDPTDEVAYLHLWPASGHEVIVGGLPVPMIGLCDVATAIVRISEAPADTLTGVIDLVAGCPTQAEPDPGPPARSPPLPALAATS
ncbi:hypothetical protein [Actinophytocola sp.]|uniref:hypothetical protein n=1 Tax=Actinophytocola sp. TaxID=1872138 RepID=UPI003D6AC40A